MKAARLALVDEARAPAASGWTFDNLGRLSTLAPKMNICSSELATLTAQANTGLKSSRIARSRSIFTWSAETLILFSNGSLRFMLRSFEKSQT